MNPIKSPSPTTVPLRHLSPETREECRKVADEARTVLTNCILTFAEGPQRPQKFLDLYVPIYAGEAACRVFFEGIGDALFPMKLNGCSTPARSPRVARLIKVSMCADTRDYEDGNPDLAWYEKTNGKIYFNV